MKTRLTFLNTRAKCEAGQTAHKTILKLGMGFGAEALLQQLIDKVDLLKLSNQDLLQSNADLTERVELLEENEGFPIKVGMVVMVNQTVTDMNDYMGYGTWVEVSEGRSPIGAGFTTDAQGESITFTVGTTGGRYKHVLTLAELPAHDHSRDEFKKILKRDGFGTGAKHDNTWHEPNITIDEDLQSVGENEPHENTHPYQVFEFWQRTA